MNGTVPKRVVGVHTRGMAGAGIGLLVAEYVEPVARTPIGWTLFAIGALTTLPIAATLIGRARRPLLAD